MQITLQVSSSPAGAGKFGCSFGQNVNFGGLGVYSHVKGWASPFSLSIILVKMKWNEDETMKSKLNEVKMKWKGLFNIV